MKEYIILEIIPTAINNGEIVQLSAIRIKGLELLDRFDYRLNEDKIYLKELVEITSYDKDLFVYKNTNEEIIEDFKKFIKDTDLLVIDNQYTLNYLSDINNKKESIFKHLNMEYSDGVIDKIITKYNLSPSNYIVDLLYEALIYESNNKIEYLDYYDETGNYIGKTTRDEVHKLGLWHNTVHCWLYDSLGNIYFQIRKEEKKFYTTASGHVAAGETVKQGFGREIKEEIGIDIDYEQATLVDVVIWKMDRPKKDGTIFVDRAFANVYVYELKDENIKFNLDENEVIGLVKVNAIETLDLFKKETGSIDATIIDVNNRVLQRKVDFKEFLVNAHETAYTKYEDVLKKVIELTK